MSEDIVRVIRIYEFSGPRSLIEEQISNSIHGEKVLNTPKGRVVIKAATLGNYPELLETAAKL